MDAPLLDERAVHQAAAGLALALPRRPQRGRVGEVLASSAGSSLELHDFREYQPGDDVRQVDWNAAARLDALVVRVRREEVAPWLDVLLDGSASLSVTPAKAARAREVALWLSLLARAAGLEGTLTVLGAREDSGRLGEAPEVLRRARLDSPVGLEAAVAARGRPRRAGVRALVSDFLVEGEPRGLLSRLAQGTSALWLVQVLDAEDVAPRGGEGVRLIDAETGEALDRELDAQALESYARRLERHQQAWQEAARALGAGWVVVDASVPWEALVRGALSPLVGTVSR